MKSLSECKGRERKGGRAVHTDAQAAPSGIHVIFWYTELVKGYFSVWLLISTSLEIVQESHGGIMQSDAN